MTLCSIAISLQLASVTVKFYELLCRNWPLFSFFCFLSLTSCLSSLVGTSWAGETGGVGSDDNEDDFFVVAEGEGVKAEPERLFVVVDFCVTSNKVGVAGPTSEYCLCVTAEVVL